MCGYAAHAISMVRNLVRDTGVISTKSKDRDEQYGTLNQGARRGRRIAVGDLVQARFNGWDLAGLEGNRRGPINRETYQVTGVRDDGGLDVAPLLHRPDGPRWGSGWCCPPSYVAEHLALAYASTVHAAQGQTVDSSHAVITSWTSLAALYVALSRGRDANTAHVATVSTVDDPAQGSERHQLHRDPVAVLAGLLDDRRPDGRAVRVPAPACSGSR